jgi:hypothetical protein
MRMDFFRQSTVLAVIVFIGSSAHAADAHLMCDGYNRVLNDHVEHEWRLAGSIAYFDNERFRVSKTPKFLVLTGHHRKIRINRQAESYKMFEYRRGRTILLEWSRKVPGEGCDIPS